MSTDAATHPEAGRSRPRRFGDGHGRTWEVIAAPHAMPGTNASAYRLFFRCAVPANPRWVPGPIVKAVRFSDQQLVGYLEDTLVRLRNSVRRRAAARPKAETTSSTADRRAATATAEKPSAGAGPAAADEYAGFGASARAGEWLPDFDDHFELVAAEEVA